MINWCEQLKPICAVCNKLVDEMIVSKNSWDGSYQIRVTCHGEVEECVLDAELVVFERSNFERGYAFTTKKIGATLKLPGEAD
jgi:hypothetical protein